MQTAIGQDAPARKYKLEEIYNEAQLDIVDPNAELPATIGTVDYWNSYIKKYGVDGFQLTKESDPNQYGGYFLCVRTTMLPTPTAVKCKGVNFIVSRFSDERQMTNTNTNSANGHDLSVLLYENSQVANVKGQSSPFVDGVNIIELGKKMSSIIYILLCRYVKEKYPTCTAMPMKFTPPYSVLSTSKLCEKYGTLLKAPFLKCVITYGEAPKLVKKGPNVGQKFDTNTQMRMMTFVGGKWTPSQSLMPIKKDTVMTDFTNGSVIRSADIDMSRIWFKPNAGSGNCDASCKAHITKGALCRNPNSSNGDIPDVDEDDSMFEMLSHFASISSTSSSSVRKVDPVEAEMRRVALNALTPEGSYE
jgi:hypothetical protein